MTHTKLAAIAFLLCPTACFAQAGGNIGYGQAVALSRIVQNERAKRTMTKEELPPDPASTFIEANVLMNVKADEYVAVFGVLEEGATVPECQQKMGATVGAFSAAAQALGVRPQDIFVDVVAQNKVYGYDVSEQMAKEKLTGFELKKNVQIRFRDYGLLDKLVAAAAQSSIYDLIKVDYVLKDADAVQAKLTAEAARVLKTKAAGYSALLGLRLGPAAQIYANKSSVYYPSEMYDGYTASESERVTVPFDRQRFVVQGARKSQTFFFNGLSANGFDSVINPVVIEPVIQCTLYMKVRYNAAPQAKQAQAGGSRR